MMGPLSAAWPAHRGRAGSAWQRAARLCGGLAAPAPGGTRAPSLGAGTESRGINTARSQGLTPVNRRHRFSLAAQGAALPPKGGSSGGGRPGPARREGSSRSAEQCSLSAASWGDCLVTRSKAERTASWVVLAVLVLGFVVAIASNGVGELVSFRFWFGLVFGWLALGLIVGYVAYLFVSTDDDAVEAMLKAGNVGTERGGA